MYALLSCANIMLITLLGKSRSKAFEKKQGLPEVQVQDDSMGLESTRAG